MKKIYIVVFLILMLFAHNLMGQSKQVVKFETAKDTKAKLENKSASGFEFSAAIPQLKFVTRETPAGGFYQIQDKQLMKTFRKGHPDLPVISKLIEIPLGAEVHVEVLSYDLEVIDLAQRGIKNKLYPAQPSPSKCADGKATEFFYNQKAYNTDEFLGDKIVRVEERGVMRYMRFGRLQIAPLKYNPVENKLKVYNNLKVRVTFKGSNEKKAAKMRSKYANPYFEALGSRAINHQPVRAKELIQSNPITYVIVSDPMFESQLQPFIDWKEKKGFHVIEAYTDDIGGTTSDIKSYLEDLYNNPDETAPSFVLFVGDIGQIPAWDGDAGSHVTDLRYCEYTGDDLPEVYYGRFSAQNTAQLQPQIDKTLEYEKYEMADPGFMGEALLVAGNDETWEDVHGNGAMWYADNYYFNSDNGIYSHLFLQDPPNGNSAVHDSIIENVNNGVGFANYTAHCSSDGWAEPSFSTSDISGLSNEGKYGLWVGNCCLSLKFDEDECFGEAALRPENSGAIGYIGGSNSTYWDEDYWWGVGNLASPVEEPTYAETGMGVYDAMFHTKSNEANDPSKWYITQAQAFVSGNLAVEASTSGRKQYYWEIYHLMGDPSLMPYLGVPDNMLVSTTPSTLMIGMNSLTVNAVPHAYVALSFNGELLATARAGETGEVQLNFPVLNDVGEADLVVTAQNRQPYIGSVTVTPSDQPYVVLDSLAVDDATGNMNGQADYGETIHLDANLANVSDTYSAIGVMDSLLTDDPNIALSDSLEEYGDIGAGSDSLRTGAFTFTVSDTVPDQHTAEFAMHIAGEDTVNDTTYVWPSTFSMKLNAPKLSIGGITVLDAASGNGDGILDPGETADIQLELSNTGHAGAPGVYGVLSTASGDLTLNKTVDTIQDFAADNTVMLTYNATADASTPVGTPADLEFHTEVVDNDFYAAQGSRQLVIGEIPEYLISDEGTVSTCVGLFYDSGGPDGAYGDDESYTMTFEPGASGKVMKAEFLSFAVEAGYDWLKIYNGTSTSAELLGTYDSDNVPETFIAENVNGALTFEFSSDGLVTKSGWKAAMSCVEMSEVTFSVTDGTNPLANAEVTLAGVTQTTGSDGTVRFLVEDAAYNYTVSKTGYEEVTGSLNVSGNVTENVVLNVLRYDIAFNLYEEDGSTPIDGEITFDGSTQTTTGGSYTFNEVAYGMNKKYTASVSDTYYTDYTDSVNVNQDRTIDITMPAKLYEVTITALDTAEVGIANSKIHINDTVHTTDSDGHALMMLPRGDYDFTVTHTGYSSASGSVSVDGSTEAYDADAMLTIQSYDITFEVYENDSVTPVDAAVTFGAATQTASSGIATFEDVVYAGVQDYQITAEEHVPQSGGIHLMKDTTLQVYMDSITYELKVYTREADGDPIFGADVILNGELKMTGIGGNVTFERNQGTYAYRINKEGFGRKEGEITLMSDSVLEFTLLPLHDVSLHVLTDSASGPVAGAAVVMDTDTLYSDADGIADTSLAVGAYPVSIEANGYEPLQDTLDITGAHSQEFRLKAMHYALNFVVQDSATNQALENAMVMITQDTLFTDSDGKAAIDLINGIYSYEVKATDYKTATGEVEVSGATEKSVVLAPLETGLQALDNGFRMYPNPANDFLILEHTNASDLHFQLMDVTGRQVKSGHLQSGHRRIHLSGHQEGLYIIRIVQGDKHRNYKLIIK